MKRYGYLFEKCLERENMIKAFENAKKHKTKKGDVLEFELSLGTNINNLMREISMNRYKPRPYITFDVYSPKQRTIYAPHFRDVVVQHAIYQTIYPIYNPTLIGQNYACRIGYGTHKANNYLQHCMRTCKPNDYYLQLDLRKYFYRINHDTLQVYLEKKIKDKRFINLLMQFVSFGETLGLPIGNLLSQLFASIYLNEMDHYIKEILHIPKYVRYVDDFILLGLSKKRCYELMAQIEEFLSYPGMTYSRWTINKISNGINFCGYRTWQNYRLIRKRSMYKFKKVVVRGNKKAVVSLFGHAQKTNSVRYLIKTIMRYNPMLLNLKPICRYREA